MNADVTSGYTVYPAIDVRNGCVVRLAQGDYARETRYRPDPLALAKTYADAGAAWLHLVDLDAARGGGYTLAALVECIKAETALKVQSGGGVRNDADLARLFGIGIDRVIVGSLAVGQRKRVAGWLAEHGAERITLALDARRKSDGRWWSMTHGWVRNGGETLGDLVRYYSRFGLRHLLCTDIERDGTLTGPNFDLYRLLRDWSPGVAIQASGGARSLDDVREVRTIGCAGIVLGKALLEGRLDLAEALAC